MSSVISCTGRLALQECEAFCAAVGAEGILDNVVSEAVEGLE